MESGANVEDVKTVSLFNKSTKILIGAKHTT